LQRLLWIQLHRLGSLVLEGRDREIFEYLRGCWRRCFCWFSFSFHFSSHHVVGNAGGCISLPGFDSDDTFDYSGALGRTLDSGVPVVLYYGKTDTACNYVGGLALANTISWKSQAEFAAAGLGPMEIAGIEAGQAKSLNGLTFIQVDSAGHMVPLDQPASSAMAIGTILQEIKQKKSH
jgi:pimeloyl-ACP methyl ester carboxylesterase